VKAFPDHQHTVYAGDRRTTNTLIVGAWNYFSKFQFLNQVQI